jgi:hypothetical protein
MINILESVNHKIKVEFIDQTRTIAKVKLDKEVDRCKAAEKDFVLWFRGADAKPDESICLVRYADRMQSLFVQIIPDTKTPAERIKLIKEKLEKNQDEDEEEEEEKKKEQNNYIFVVDRSGSMLFTIGLVKNALKVFLQGLDEESYFNICSFGNKELK